jgi:hypothetical protein
MDMEFRGVTNNHGDGFGGANEVYIGTNPLKRCGDSGANWPADLVASNSVNVSDVLALKPVFGSSVTTNAGARLDIVPSKTINVSDVLGLKPFFGTSCTAGGEMVP